MILFLTMTAFAWDLRNEGGRTTGQTIDAASVFTPATPAWDGVRMVTPTAAIGAAARDTLAFLEEAWVEAPHAAPAGLQSELGVTPERVRATLSFVARVAAEDRGVAAPRLADSAFLEANFDVLSWVPDQAAATKHGVRLDPGEIRLTRYLVDQVEGSPVRTEAFPHALYAPPDDGALITRYARREVLDGVYETGEAAGKARPLVWVRRQSVHDALMQGTIEVRLPDGSRHTYNVEVHNGVAYDRSISDPEQQDRYWYFREVSGVGGWGAGAVGKIPLHAFASVAGDARNLGLGTVFALEEDGALRLVVLSDTGGAFQPNLYQLDLFTGAWPSRAAFAAGTADVPDRPRAWVLLLKP